MLTRETTGAMLAKQEYQESIERHSRETLWEQRLEEFKSSPIIGIGFAAHGTEEDKTTSRVELGGGWIAVLSQIGILGAIIIAIINIKALLSFNATRNDYFMSYIYALYIFFCIHSIVEGYMLQGGWYMCIILWMTQGLLIEHKRFGKLLTKK